MIILVLILKFKMKCDQIRLSANKLMKSINYMLFWHLIMLVMLARRIFLIRSFLLSCNLATQDDFSLVTYTNSQQ